MAPAPPDKLIERLAPFFEQALAQGVFPGAAVGIASGPPGERHQLLLSYGRTGCGPEYGPMGPETCFDLASLTKPLATTLAILCLLQEKKLSLDSPLPDLLSDFIPSDKKSITLRHLLGHRSGLPAHRPYFEALRHHPPEDRQQLARKWILAEPLLNAPGKRALYSDLGFMLLGWIVEEKAGEKLDHFVARKIYQPLGLADRLFFRPLGDPGPSASYAATERCPWRTRVLCGEVHDDNGFALGGIAGHAGLFGMVDGVLALVVHLLEVRQGRSTPLHFRPEDLRTFLTSEGEVADSSWGLGFDTPSPTGSSSGRHLSSASFGHLGFTGTSFWVDPDRELAIVLLSNRVHPVRDNDRIRTFRPLFHDLVVETLFPDCGQGGRFRT